MWLHSITQPSERPTDKLANDVCDNIKFAYENSCHKSCDRPQFTYISSHYTIKGICYCIDLDHHPTSSWNH